jgi:hypothetical protein
MSNPEADAEKDLAQVREILGECLDGTFQDACETFMVAQAPVFADADAGEGEHRLEYTAAFTEWVALFERQLEAPLASRGLTAERFFEVCKAVADEDPIVDASLEILLSVTEYQLFFDLVRDPAKRQYLRTVLKGFRSMMG